MVLELISVQESGKELLEGDLAWSLQVIRDAVAKPPLGKSLGPRRRVEHAQWLLRGHEEGLVALGSFVKESEVPRPVVGVQLSGGLS